MLVTCKGDADPKGAQAAEEPQAHPQAGDEDPGPIPKTASVTRPSEQQFLPSPSGLHALFIFHI